MAHDAFRGIQNGSFQGEIINYNVLSMHQEKCSHKSSLWILNEI